MIACRLLLLISYLAISAPAWALPIRELQPGLQVTTEGSFCPDTGARMRWQEAKPPFIRTWVSKCGSAADVPGRAISGTFQSRDAITLYLVGNIGLGGHLYLENTSTGSKLAIVPTEMLSGTWRPLHFKLPVSWRQKPLRLIAVFDGAKQGDWMGFSEPVVLPEGGRLGAVLSVLVRAVLYFGLLSLPFAVGVLIGTRRPVKSEPALVVLGLIAVGVAGYFAFWLWLLRPRLGLIYDLALPSLCAAYVFLFVRRSSTLERARLLIALQPWLLMFATLLFMLFAGFLYGGIRHPLDTAQVRYTPFFLPADNVLPSLFAEQLAHGKWVHPFFIDWLTSDRPPLQTGFDLLLYPFLVTPRELRNEISSVLVQCFWLPALWAFLRVLLVSRRAILLAISALVFSQFVLLNSFFVWPKLLAAAFMLAGSALLLSIRAPGTRNATLGLAAASGACVALGFLAHGGVFFSLFGLALLLAFRQRRPRALSLAVAAAACVLVYLPWTGYQKFYDPPGDRLLKLHLAGVQQVDKRPFLEVLRSSYAKLTWHQILNYRVSNIRMIFDSQQDYWGNVLSFIETLPHDLTHEQKIGGAPADALNTLEFYFVQPTLGLLMFGPLFLVAGFWRRFRTPLWHAASVCWIYFAGTVLGWLALMFKPISTTIHQGSYALILVGIAGSVLAIWNVSRGLALTVVALQSALGVLASVVYSRGVAPVGILTEATFDPASLILLAAAAAVVLLFWMMQHRTLPIFGLRTRLLRSRMRLVPSAFLVFLVFSVAPLRAQHSGLAGFTIPRVMSAPFASGLVAAPKGATVAWLENVEGRRNVWLASGPDWHAKQITSFTQDDGQEIADLAWAPDGSFLLFARGGDFENGGENPNPDLSPQKPDQSIWRVDLPGGAVSKVTEGQAPAVSATDVVIFVRKGQVFTLKNGREAAPLLEQKGTQSDLRWSPDGSQFAFVSNRAGHSFIGVFTMADHEVRYLDPSIDRDNEPIWSPDGSAIAFLREPTEGREAFFSPRRAGPPWSIRVADVRSGTGREVFRADSGPGSVFRAIEAQRQIFWAGDRLVFPWERTGWLHLYSIPAAGGAPVELTPGAGEVEYVAQSHDGAHMFYSTNIGDIDRRHIASVAVDGTGKAAQITAGVGIEWQPAPLADTSAVAFLNSSVHRPAHASVLAENHKPQDIGPEPPSNFPSPEEFVKPQPVLITAADGLQLHGQLFLPPGTPGTRHPALIFFHGGSRRQMLLGYHYMYYYSNAYSLNQYLASQGYVVLAVNYRSGIGYGLDFREAIHYGAQGGSEFNDVLGAGVYLKARPDVDPKRIGVWGGSYGGYLTAMALSRASDLFAAGVDFHGVHDWSSLRGYLMRGEASGDPRAISERQEAARIAFESSPMASVDTWRSPVLLIHGDDDRNVEFSQTLILAEALRQRGVTFEQLIFPNEIHDFLLHRHWVQAYEATSGFFARKLKGEAMSMTAKAR